MLNIILLLGSKSIRARRLTLYRRDLVCQVLVFRSIISRSFVHSRNLMVRKSRRWCADDRVAPESFRLYRSRSVSQRISVGPLYECVKRPITYSSVPLRASGLVPYSSTIAINPLPAAATKGHRKTCVLFSLGSPIRLQCLCGLPPVLALQFKGRKTPCSRCLSTRFEAQIGYSLSRASRSESDNEL